MVCFPKNGFCKDAPFSTEDHRSLFGSSKYLLPCWEPNNKKVRTNRTVRGERTPPVNPRGPSWGGKKGPCHGRSFFCAKEKRETRTQSNPFPFQPASPPKNNPGDQEEVAFSESLSFAVGLEVRSLRSIRDAVRDPTLGFFEDGGSGSRRASVLDDDCNTAQKSGIPQKPKVASLKPWGPADVESLFLLGCFVLAAWFS